MSEQFEFLLLEGFSNMVLASALEPLRDVRLRSTTADLDWEVTTLGGETIQSSSRLRVSPDRPFDPEVTSGTLVIAAGYHVREHITRQMVAKLRKAARKAKRVIALDTAAWLLAEAGVLDGHNATIHWQELDAFQEAFPNVSVSNARFVKSGNILTCGGASAALDLMLELIKELFGPAAAFDAYSMFLFDPARRQTATNVAKPLSDRGSPKLLEALNVIAENVEQPLTTFELARQVAISERSLNRVFSVELGMTPGKYYRLYRLQHARYLVQETRLSVEQIAMRCGFSGASSLGRSFLREFGKPIGALRV
ncbi:GlxA family transcriptional regulator [Ruegeria arenilitoris]|uniref:GlxA family transcriptional regulator n=1 Tax=Ruegeria arenilitoris TaxID=1173585 RepID=UPI00147AC65B|nr:GlxA family transcriptional regulator [Ruegeria arenilitoris]